MQSVEKILSENDLGLTKSHQAGFLIPKHLVQQGMFEKLTDQELNPRIRLKMTEKEIDQDWFFSYIYYNNKYFGGSRSEYRLTGLASFLRGHSLRPGDAIVFTRVDQYDYEIRIKKARTGGSVLTSESWAAIYGEKNT